MTCCQLRESGKVQVVSSLSLHMQHDQPCRTHLAHFVHHLLDLLLIHTTHACLGCRKYRAVALPARSSCLLLLAIVLLLRLLRRWVCLSLVLLHDHFTPSECWARQEMNIAGPHAGSAVGPVGPQHAAARLLAVRALLVNVRRGREEEIEWINWVSAARAMGIGLGRF